MIKYETYVYITLKYIERVGDAFFVNNINEDFVIVRLI